MRFLKLNRFRKSLRREPLQQPYEEEIKQFEPVPDQYQPADQYQQPQSPPQQYGYEQPQQQELTPELIQEIQRMQMEEQLRQQQMQQGISVQPVPEVKDGDNPLSILDEIKAQPSSKGTYPMLIGGRPVDLHVLEDYITKISPFALKTILRYHNARTIEELKGYSGRGSLKLKGGTIILILVAIGLAVGGIIMLLYMPDIMSYFKGGIGVQ